MLYSDKEDGDRKDGDFPGGRDGGHTPGRGPGGDRGSIPPGQMQSPRRMAFAWIVVMLVAMSLASLWMKGRPEVREVAYSPDFFNMLELGLVDKVEILHGSPSEQVSTVSGTIPDSIPDTHGYPRDWTMKTTVSDGFLNMLEAGGVGIVHKTSSNRWEMFLYSFAPTLLLIGMIYFIFLRQMKAAGGAMNFGKSKAKQLSRDKNKVLFKDVAGIEESKEEVQEIVEYLRDPAKFQRLGGKMPRGVLLCGAPGTGKTLLAKAIAGEADVPFFSISGSDFVEMFVGVGASRVRDMFDQAKKNSPCIIFIDEIDAVGRSRFTGIGGGHDEREQTLNALLVEMDGFDATESVVVIAATNRPDVLDPALLRPGRFDRQVVVDLPSLDGRVDILKVHMAKVKVAAGVDVRRIARGTPGFSGADLANLVNEAALIAARHNKEFVDIDDFEEARDKVMWGKERRSRKIDDKDKRITAYHEAGHAALTVLSRNMDPLHKVTIIPRGMSLGSTMFLPEKDRTHVSKAYLLDELVVSMGGRAAEEVFLPDICTGAKQDLAQASRLARAMVCEWGMSDVLGPRAFGHQEELVFLGREVNRTQDYSEKTAQMIDAEISRLLREAHDRAVGTLREHKEAVDKLVELLLEKETIDGRDAEDIIRFGRIRTPEERGDPPPEPPPPVPGTDGTAASGDNSAADGPASGDVTAAGGSSGAGAESGDGSAESRKESAQ